jgi:chromosome segregation ATPase
MKTRMDVTRAMLRYLVLTFVFLFHSDFGAIFGDLLPGNTAMLAPCEGKTIADGLEVKVCLGGVWKESLTELSGGQR